jgi:hypothetical protein
LTGDVGRGCGDASRALLLLFETVMISRGPIFPLVYCGNVQGGRQSGAVDFGETEAPDGFTWLSFAWASEPAD